MNEGMGEGGPTVQKFEALVAEFEAKHDLEALNAIVELSPDLFEMFHHADDLADERRIAAAMAMYTAEYREIYKAKIARLRAMVLPPEDAEKLKIRTAARKDLIPILKMLNSLPQNLRTLAAHYRRLSRAVGMINNSKVEHDRG